MTDCRFCKRPMTTYSEADEGHAVCNAEWVRRSEAGLCVFCGERDSLETSFRCAACMRGNGQYTGYPPGGA